MIVSRHLKANDWWVRTVFVLGTGPSLSTAQVSVIARERLADRCRVIAVNDAVLVAWFADIAFAADRQWWKARGDLADFPGRRLALAETYYDAPFQVLHRSGSEGFEERFGHLCTHGHSGAMAVQLAAQLGGAPIVLVGFDMKKVAGARHFFGEYEKDLAASPDMGVWIKEFHAIADALPGRLFNATPDSALSFIPPFDLPAAA